MKKILFIMLGLNISVLVGCSTTKTEIKEGEFFTLTNRNVYLRDLKRPVSTDNEPIKYEYKTFPQQLL